jgi:NAD(P)-dependent dehydrogenase (short-subunit alcohol dehydrogenase family)
LPSPYAGLGLEFVKQCAAIGAAVVATHRGPSIPAALSGLGPLVTTLSLDVSDPSSVKSAAMSLQNRPGFNGVTHVIHNAGVFESMDTGLMQMTKERMMKMFEVNAIGVLLVAQSFVPLMTNTREGGLPIFACLSSKVGSVDDNQSGRGYAYRASKSAANIICKSLSVDLKGTCAVCCLHPGYVRTDMTVRTFYLYITVYAHTWLLPSVADLCALFSTLCHVLISNGLLEDSNGAGSLTSARAWTG